MGELQAAKPPLSKAHRKVASASLAKENAGLALLLGFAGEAVMPAVGAAVSIVQVKLAAVPVLPALSVALTWKVCRPSAMLA